MLPVFRYTKRKGFTLIELLLVIGIISILISVMIGVINPFARLAHARNAQRLVDTRALMESFAQYSIDHLNNYQPTLIAGQPLLDACKISGTAKKICKFTVENGTAEGQCGHVDLGCIYSAHLSGTYLSPIPIDPGEPESEWEIGNEAYLVNYSVERINSTYRLKVEATNTELDASVFISM